MFKLALVIIGLIFSQSAFSDTELECLAKNIYFEARGESLSGMVAVANVTMNRVNHDKFPNTICGVVKQAKYYTNWKGNRVPRRNACQFSWFCDGKSDDPIDLIAYETSIKIAKVVMSGYIDITRGSLFYHNHSVDPHWSKSMSLVKVIGAHNFYRDS
jgi:spore germination cell wall hydrolase CwlJ-like protein